MFQGSKHHDTEYFGPLEKLGAQINGSTSTDRTNYYEALPTNGLETALWLEVRPDGLPPAGPDPGQARQPARRGQERAPAAGRQRPLRPGPGEDLGEALYPSDHPYHHSVIGSMADLSAASLGDVATFFRTYYSPNNASLTIAGDFDPAEARQLVEKYFGPIPAGPRGRPGSSPSVPTLTEPQPPDDDRRRPARPDPARLADRPAGRPRRGGARRPGRDPRPAPQREPPLPRPPVRQATGRPGRRLPLHQRPRGHLRRLDHPPARARSSTT